MKNHLSVICGLLAIVPGATALATPLPPTGTFLYTDQCAADGERIAGHRVALLRTKAGMKAQIDFQEDGTDAHDLASNVRFDAKTNALSFSFKAGDARHVFKGTVTREALTGIFDKDKPSNLKMVEIPKGIR